MSITLLIALYVFLSVASFICVLLSFDTHGESLLGVLICAILAIGPICWHCTYLRDGKTVVDSSVTLPIQRIDKGQYAFKENGCAINITKEFGVIVSDSTKLVIEEKTFAAHWLYYSWTERKLVDE